MTLTYNEADAQAIIKFWRSKGFRDIEIAGWLANWYAEARLRSNNAQNGPISRLKVNGVQATDELYTQWVDDGTYTREEFINDRIGYGKSQWTSAGRKTGLYDSAKAQGVSIANDQMQMDYAYREITSSGYKKAYNALKLATTPGEAAIALMRFYEIPASADDKNAQATRAAYAEEFYNKYFTGSNAVVIAWSAGHYLYEAGKRCMKSLDPKETREWVLNSRVVDYCIAELNNYDGIVNVRLDDPTGQTAVTLEERAKVSDYNKAKLYIAVHHNAGAKGGKAGGIVVYHYPLERNKVQATEMYNLLIKYTGLKGDRAQPVIATTKLYEVRVPKADSLLIENGFMDSQIDTPIILTDEHARKSAQAIVEYVVKCYNLKRKDESKSDILAEIESIKNNIATLQARLAELEAQL